MAHVFEKKVTTATTLAVTDEGLKWPVSREALELLALSKYPLLVAFYHFLLKEMIDSTRNVKTIEDFITTFLPVMYGCFHGASIGPVSERELKRMLTQFLEDDRFKSFLEYRYWLGPFLVYSLLVGEIVSVLPPEFVSIVIEQQ